MFIWIFPMIFQSSMGPRNSKCDIPSGTTQGQNYLISLLQFPCVRKNYLKCIMSNHLSFKEMPSSISMG
jgi:hypothetical protein